MSQGSTKTTLLAVGAVATGAAVLYGIKSGLLPRPLPLAGPYRRRPAVPDRSRQTIPELEAEIMAPFRQRGGALVAYTPVETPVMDPKTKRAKVNRRTGEPVTVTRSAETADLLASRASAALGRPVPPETFLLAAMIASEVGGRHGLARLGVAHAALNYSRRGGHTLRAMLTPDGRVGAQIGRYASTRLMPAAEDVAVAELVRAGRVADPTRGAIQFDSPRAQQQGYDEGWAGYGSLDELTRKRLAANLEPVELPGVSIYELRFWRPKGAATA